MKKRIIRLFGAIVVLPSLTSLLQPQLALALNSKSEKLSLADNSLVRLETRTIKDDYKLFFSNRQNTSSEVFGNVHNYNAFSVFSDGDDGVWQINEDVKLLVNEPLVERNNILTPRQDFYEGIDRVEVQTELFE
ncbi:MAG: hypothetical protein IGS49_29585 [Chlorogloeopsis fritschii C42_A2020_084]|uniref:hypothetical protein n=1 Tax=Chlorogloeopsis fritschii TaxID=1124 RepID=UPI0019EF3209|nr:hypothetical protein [Chlorogloeopsis fritschii]MBF2009465.1 hypothetical protein [Chlorogloeopsis fritschii C42_A2020_084]